MNRLFTTFLLCLVATGLLSQVSEPELPLITILANLEDKHNVTFAYDPDQLPKEALSYIDSNADLNTSLSQICEALDMQFKQVGQQVLLRKNTVRPVHTFLRLKGQVLDEQKQALFGALIFSNELNIHAETDEAGFFELVLPTHQNEAHICIQYLGYENNCQTVQTSDQSIDFQLTPQNFAFEAVTISSVALKMNLTTVEVVKKEQLNSLSSLSSSPMGADALRAIQLMAGVDATNDRSANISIRNGSQEESLVMLEEMSLFHTSHMQGFVSTLNPLVTSTISLYKNYVPIEQGSRTGGLVLASVDGFGDKTIGGAINVDNLTYNVQLNSKINNTQILAAYRSTWAPISDRSSLISSTSTNTLNQEIEVYQVDPVYSFDDFNFSLESKIGKSTLSINSLLASDDYSGLSEFEIETENEEEEEEFKRKDFLNTQQNLNSFSIGATFKTPISERLELEAALSNTRFLKNEDNSFRSQNGSIFSYSNKLEQTIAKLQINYSKPRWKLQAGIVNTFYEVDFNFSFEGFRYLNNQAPNARSTGIFGKWSREVTKKTFLNVAGRLEYYDANQKVYPAGNITLQHRHSADLLFKASYARAFQLLRDLQHQGSFGNEVSFWALANDNLFPTLSSNQWMLGFEFLNTANWHIDFEAFFRNNQGMAQYALTNFKLENSDLDRIVQNLRQFEGISKTVGLDLSIQKKWKHLSTNLQYSIADKRMQFDGIINGDWFRSPDNRLHQLMFANTIIYKNWRLNANVIWGSSTLTIDLDELEEEDRDIQKIPFEELYEPLPSYLRVDMGIQYHLQTKNNPLVLSLTTFNITNRQNILARYYVRLKAPNASQSNISAFEQALLGRILNVGLRYTW